MEVVVETDRMSNGYVVSGGDERLGEVVVLDDTPNIVVVFHELVACCRQADDVTRLKKRTYVHVRVWSQRNTAGFVLPLHEVLNIRDNCGNIKPTLGLQIREKIQHTTCDFLLDERHRIHDYKDLFSNRISLLSFYQV